MPDKQTMGSALIASAVPAAVGAGLADGWLGGVVSQYSVGIFLALGLVGSSLQGALLLGTGADSFEGLMEALRRALSDADAGARLMAFGTVVVAVFWGEWWLLHSLLDRFQHVGLIFLCAVAGAALMAVLGVCWLQPLQTLWGWILRFLGRPSRSAVGLVLCVLLGGLLVVAARWGGAVASPDPRVPVVVLVFLALQGGSVVWLLRRRSSWRRAIVVGGLLIATVLSGELLWSPRPVPLERLRRQAPMGSAVLALVLACADGDADGHASVAGGQDCDDSDADTYPGAPDPPADGLDRDCDGND